MIFLRGEARGAREVPVSSGFHACDHASNVDDLSFGEPPFSAHGCDGGHNLHIDSAYVA